MGCIMSAQEKLYFRRINAHLDSQVTMLAKLEPQITRRLLKLQKRTESLTDMGEILAEETWLEEVASRMEELPLPWAVIANS